MPLTPPEEKIHVTPIVRGESASSSIAAASIIAKVTRDALLEEYARIFPQFSLNKHKGYGTPSHIQELKTYGRSIIHRTSFVVESLKKE